MKVSPTTLVILTIIVIFLLVVMTSGKQRSDFTFNNAMYQYGNASIDRQYNYFDCVEKECGGNTTDYFCMQKCRFKASRQGMKAPDVKDMVCAPYQNDEHAYYRCLAATYADYKYP